MRCSRLPLRCECDESATKNYNVHFLRARTTLQPITVQVSVSVWLKFSISRRNLKLHLLSSTGGDKCLHVQSREAVKSKWIFFLEFSDDYRDRVASTPRYTRYSLFHTAVSFQFADDCHHWLSSKVQVIGLIVAATPAADILLSISKSVGLLVYLHRFHAFRHFIYFIASL